MPRPCLKNVALAVPPNAVANVTLLLLVLMLTFAPVTTIFADTSCVLPGPYCRMPVDENWIVPELVRALGPNISVP